MKRLTIRQVKSLIGRPKKHRRVMASLGLGKVNRTVEHDASAQIMGMINKVAHLVEWREVTRTVG